MDFQKLNKISKIEQRELKKLSELNLNEPYEIFQVKQVTTRFGQKVIAELNDNIVCYLPARVSNELLSSNERGLEEFKEELKISKVYMKILEGPYTPVEFSKEKPKKNKN